MDKVVHFEVPADDLNRAQEFYKKVFGWEMTPAPEMEYLMVKTGEKEDQGKWPFINGGIMKRTNGMAGTVITIDVPDLEATLKLLEENGGKMIKEKQSVMDMGFLAYAQDSEGNIIGIWQNTK